VIASPKSSPHPGFQPFVRQLVLFLSTINSQLSTAQEAGNQPLAPGGGCQSQRKSLQKALFQKPLVVLDFFVLWPELHFANPFFKSRALI
jgi:hypothetical protein